MRENGPTGEMRPDVPRVEFAAGLAVVLAAAVLAGVPRPRADCGAPTRPPDRRPAATPATRSADPCALPTGRASSRRWGSPLPARRPRPPRAPLRVARRRPELGITVFVGDGGLAHAGGEQRADDVPGPPRGLPGAGDVHRHRRVLPVRRRRGAGPGAHGVARGREPRFLHRAAGRAARRRGELALRADPDRTGTGRSPDQSGGNPPPRDAPMGSPPGFGRCPDDRVRPRP